MGKKEVHKKSMFDKGSILNYYTLLADEHGFNVQSLGWKSLESQRKRFKVLCEIGDLRGKRILDIGCGLADIYDYLISQGINLDYTGVDITLRMIELAKSKYPELKLEVLDILNLKNPSPIYDYLLASGIFNLKINKQEDFVYQMINRMFELCKCGIAFNIQSSYSDTFDKNEYYANPIQLLDYCFHITRWVVLRHEYMPHDFTIYMYREKKND